MSNYGAPQVDLARFRTGMHIKFPLHSNWLGPADVHYLSSSFKADDYAWGVIVSMRYDERLEYLRQLSGKVFDVLRFEVSMELSVEFDVPCKTCMPTELVYGFMDDERSSPYNGRSHQVCFVKNTGWVLGSASKDGMHPARVDMDFQYVVSDAEMDELRKQKVPA